MVLGGDVTSCRNPIGCFVANAACKRASAAVAPLDIHLAEPGRVGDYSNCRGGDGGIDDLRLS